MAKKGTYAAFQQLQPISTDFGKIAQDNELLRMKREEQKRLEKATENAQMAANAKAENDRRNKLTENYNKSYALLGSTVTGIGDFDTVVYDQVKRAQDIRTKIYHNRLADSNYDSKNPNTAQIVANLNNFPKDMVRLQKVFVDNATPIITAKREGTLSAYKEDNDKFNMLQSVAEKNHLGMTFDNLGRSKAVYAKVDDDGEILKHKDGNIILEEMPLEDMSNGVFLGGFTTKLTNEGYYTIVKNIGESLASKEYKNTRGLTTEQKIEFNKEDAKTQANIGLGTWDNPSSKAKSIWGDIMGNTDTNITSEGDFNKIVDKLASDSETFFDTKDFETFDYKEAYDITKDKEETTTDSGGLKPMSNIQSKLESSLDGEGPMVENIANVKYGVTPPAEVKFTTKEGEIILDGLYITKDNKLFYSGVMSAGTTSEEGVAADPNKPSKVGPKTTGIKKRGRVVSGEATDNLARKLAAKDPSLSHLKDANDIIKEILKVMNDGSDVGAFD